MIYDKNNLPVPYPELPDEPAPPNKVFKYVMDSYLTGSLNAVLLAWADNRHKTSGSLCVHDQTNIWRRDCLCQRCVNYQAKFYAHMLEFDEFTPPQGTFA